MKAAQRQELWMRLVEAGMAEGEAPAPSNPESPWFVRVMLGVAGWIGALFLLAFGGVLMSSLFDNAPLALLIGAGLCAGAAFLFRLRGENDFVSQFGFAVSLAGQALILIGLFRLFETQTTVVALGMAVVQAALFVLVPSFLHRVWAAGLGALALAVALSSLDAIFLVPGLLTLAFAGVWLRELDDARRSALWQAAGYGLTCAAALVILLPDLLVEIGRNLSQHEGPVTFLLLRPYLGAAVSGAALLSIVRRLLAREGVPLGSGPGRTALAGAGLLVLASFAAPGLATAVAILVLGHANGNRVLTGLGIAVLLGYLSVYYYSLDTTLLVKSVLLVGVGSALLLVRLSLHRWWPAAAGEDGHA